MDTTVPQTKPQSDAEYIAAIEEMQRRIELSFARMDELDARTRASMERTDKMLSRIEESQAARKR